MTIFIIMIPKNDIVKSLMKNIPHILLYSLVTACLVIPVQTQAAFGLNTSTDYYEVDTDAGLVFRVRRVDDGSSTRSPGDIMSLVYNGTEYQNQSRGSHINSGFDYLGYSNPTVNVSAETIGSDYIKITVTTEHLTHYYIARNGYPHIYMATWFDEQPITGGGLCRYIVRMPSSNLPNGPEPSEIIGTDYTVESGDIFGFSSSNSIVELRGKTRSKHYSNHRLIDWKATGATGNGVGVFMVRDSQEGGSGGPFYRSLINQGGGDQEITYILNYGQTQTEAFRPGTLNGIYTLVFTNGEQPDTDLDYSWVDSEAISMTSWVSEANRGAVSGTASGIPDGFEAVVGFANSTAQYWAEAGPDGAYITEPMIPGTYDVTLYKQELAVAADSVTVTAENTNILDIASSEANPSIIWRIGDRDGTPNGFMNADKATWMHPSDVRMGDWNLGAFNVGSDLPLSGIPCYQWKGIGGGQDIQFELTAGQIVDTTVNVGITVAYAGARPNLQVNESWYSDNYAPSSQPDSRSLTTGSYRGNNTEFAFTVPASALVAGVNTLRVYPISGSGFPTGFLSAGYSLDYVEWQGAPVALPAAPAGLYAKISDTQIALSWDPIPSAVRYVVQRAPTADGPYTTLSDDVGAAHYSDTSATNGTVWFYRVSAVNGLGPGTPSEISTAASHLTTHYQFNETTGSRAEDSAGNNNGTLMSGASWTTGTTDNAVQLDGTSTGYVELPDGLVETLSDCTFSIWVNASSIPTWSRIFDFGMGTESYMFLSPNSGSSTVRFAITLASGGNEQQLNSGSALATGGWHHIAITLSGDTGTLYIDGSVADTQTISIDPADLGLTSHNFIGKSQYPDDYPTAKIDDFRIYSSALSGTEIAAMASQTPPSAPSSLTASATTNAVTLNWPAVSGATTYNVKRATTSGGPYTLIAGGITGTGFSFLSAESDVYEFIATAENLAGESGPSPEAELLVVKIPGQPVPSASPVAYYRFEEGSAGSPVPNGIDDDHWGAVIDLAGGDDNMNAYQASGAPEYSALVPVTTLPQTGGANSLSTYFDGSDDLYGTISGMSGGSGFDFTIEAYVKFSGLGGYQTVVGRDDVGDETPGLEALFYLQKTGANALRVLMFDDTSTLIQAVTGNGTIGKDVWYHIAAVGDASAGTLKLYLNGNLIATSSDTYTGMFASSQTWTIGRGFFGSFGDNVTGMIDEVRFCAAALSPEQFIHASRDVPDDSDLDGLSDVFENYYFGNLAQDEAGDFDGDGDDNGAEQLAGTPPTISAIPPEIGISMDAGDLNLNWSSNHIGWILMSRSNLLTGDWEEVSGSNATNVYDGTLPNDSAFYKLVYP